MDRPDHLDPLVMAARRAVARLRGRGTGVDLARALNRLGNALGESRIGDREAVLSEALQSRRCWADEPDPVNQPPQPRIA